MREATVVFPHLLDSSFYHGGMIFLGYRFSTQFDCILHEYGHLVSCDTNTCGYVYAIHGYGDRTTDLVPSVQQAELLALSEGLATFLSEACQMYYPERFSNYANYADEISGNHQMYFWENASNDSFGYRPHGYCCEGDIARVLLKMCFDNDLHDYGINLGHGNILESILYGSYSNFQQLMHTLYEGNPTVKEQIALLLSDHQFVPAMLDGEHRILNTNPLAPCWNFAFNPTTINSLPSQVYGLEFVGRNETYSIEMASNPPELTTSDIDVVLGMGRQTSIRAYTRYPNSLNSFKIYGRTVTCSLPSFQKINGGSQTLSILPGTTWLEYSCGYPAEVSSQITSSAEIDIFLFNDPVADNSAQPGTSIRQDDGDFQINGLSTSPEYPLFIRVEAQSLSTLTIATQYTHEHSFTESYLYYSSRQHTAFCICGANSKRAHTFLDENIYTLFGHTFNTCLQCNSSIEVGSGGGGISRP